MKRIVLTPQFRLWPLESKAASEHHPIFRDCTTHTHMQSGLEAPSKSHRQRPELLAPAGNRLCVTAAVENGADAVYFGLECGFNARARAANLHLDDLPEVMMYLHARGVWGYVTLNTLVFPSELEAVERTVVRLTEAGVDAVLVQDLGLVRLIRAISPDLSIHASTQMTLTSAECIRVAEQLGIERVVLARELSLREIRKIRRQTSVELEVFVHGALCVAYSGQCLTSESLGGRSANRGQCAQACRLPYDLVCDDRDVDLGRVKYLLSPQDLAAYALVPELIDAGVSCFKIEGRLKTPEYVANITHHYRRAIDAAMENRPLDFTERDITDMEMSFSRGFSPGWLNGCNHKILVPGLSSAKRGVLLGAVKQVRGRRVVVTPARAVDAVAPGDGVVFAGDREHGDEQGGRVYEVVPRGPNIELSFARDAIDLGRLQPGQQVWKTDDPQLNARWRKTFTGAKPSRRVWLDLMIDAAVGHPLRIAGNAGNGATCAVESAEPLAASTKHPLSDDVLRQQLGRLGATAYELRNLTAHINGQPMVPLSVLGQMRHAMVAQLEQSALTRPLRRIRTRGEAGLCESPRATAYDGVTPPTLRVLCRSLEQLRAVLDFNVCSVMVDFQDIREYRQAVELAAPAGVEILLATPRIQKPDELGIFHALAKHGASGFLVRNFAGMAFCAEHGIAFVCDFSLNAANQWTVDYLKSCGAQRVTVSYDLNRDQLLDLVDAVPAAWLEVVIHQHMPMFHMEHCVFCAVLSPGTDKTNCGRPCDEHVVKMRDRVGYEHVLQADIGCRNTLFNAVPQSAAEAVPTLLARGLRDFRIEFLTETADQLRTTIRLYRELLDSRTSGKQVWQRLQASNRVGVTRGTLEERRNPLAIL
jgi:putative protease